MNSKMLIIGALFITAVLGVMGGTTLNAVQTFAQNTASPINSPSLDSGDDDFDPAKDGHVGENGTREELLTGDTAEKVRTASLAAVSGGTVERVETDAEGSPYEAHMKKSDGTRVTVKLDSNFKVTNIEEGSKGGAH